MREVVIVDLARSAIGKIGGTMKDLTALEILTPVAKAVVERNKAKVKTDIYDYVLIGQVKQNTRSANIARNLVLKIGLPEEVPAASLTIACGSGLLSMMEGYEMISNGFADVILAGGCEAMSSSEFFLYDRVNQAFGTGNVELKDSLIAGGPGTVPEDRYGNLSMGVTAENLAEIHHIDREEQDKFALRSQTLALKAIQQGDFEKEIVAVPYKKSDGSMGIFQVDEYPRETSMEAMAKLKPVFKKNGTITAANSSGRNDGASVALLMSREKADELGIKPRARIVAASIAGVDPRIMGRGPVPSTKNALDKAGLTLKDMDLIELNEAFAAQSLAVYREWQEMWNVTREWLDAHVNLWGGAIALGHPLGGSGAIITTKLINGLERTGGRYGLSTLCCGGGMGVACIFERLNAS